MAAKKSQAKEYAYLAPHVEGQPTLTSTFTSTISYLYLDLVDEVDTPNEDDMNTRDIETWGQVRGMPNVMPNVAS